MTSESHPFVMTLASVPTLHGYCQAAVRSPDLVLIHPPSVFDFRERTIFYGPISDVIPSSPVFEMYPIGFLTLATSILNYETEWMTRAEIVNATYDAAERLNDLKAAHGRVSPSRAQAVRRRLKNARILRKKLAAAGNGPLDPVTHKALLGEIREFSEGTINDKAELFEAHAFLRNFRIGGILRLLLREMQRAA
jgi:hypothetical protein